MANTQASSSLSEWLESVPTFIEQLNRHRQTDDLVLANRLHGRSEDYLLLLQALCARTEEEILYMGDEEDLNELIGDLQALAESIVPLANHYRDWVLQLIDSESGPTVGIVPQRVYLGGRGRPQYHIPQSQLEALIELRFSYESIAKMLNVSTRTLQRRRMQYGLPSGRWYTEISDHDLDNVIKDILQLTPTSGLQMIIGALRGRNIYLQRWRVLSALRRVDPISRSLQRLTIVYRRCYSVPGPNALWHLDGHHKLIRWKLVIHGAIDGYSRLVTYLHCSDNNRADTVHKLFLQACREYNVPSRIRCDHGGENVDVARWMIENRGCGRSSVITGSSVHNARIERLWRDLRRVVVRPFSNLFYYLESCGILNPLDDVHLFALHYVYVPRINRALDEFRVQYIHHPMRTAHNRSPFQIFHEAVFHFSTHTGSRSILQDEVPEMFGVDEEAPWPDLSNDSEEVVNVHSPRNPLQSQQFDELVRSVDPDYDDQQHGITLYENVLNFINRQQQN